jgi:ComF family protein
VDGGLEFRPPRLQQCIVAALNLLLNFIFPPSCAGCASRFAIDAARRVCDDCLAQIERIEEPFCVSCGIPFETQAGQSHLCGQCIDFPPHFTRARSAARYRASADEQSVLASMIRRHKYAFDQSLGRALAECLGDELPLPAGGYDLVVPVPLHRARLRWRGFNQAALLGAAIARRMNLPLDVLSLVRSRHTPPQTEQDPDTRRHNVRKAFRVAREDRIQGRRVLLVDDVMTTGATVNECARVLVSADAARVDVLTLARAL